MIEVRNVYKSFNGKEVLKDISFTFEAGKTNLIIGQSGSGKTVLMKSVIGIHQVDKGQILYNGRDFTKMSNKETALLRQEIGMLFQGSALFDSMTVEENVRFPLEMFSDKTRKEWEKRIPEVYEILRKGSLAAEKVAAQTLSEVKDAMKINYFDDMDLIQEQAKRFAEQ